MENNSKVRSLVKKDGCEITFEKNGWDPFE